MRRFILAMTAIASTLGASVASAQPYFGDPVTLDDENHWTNYVVVVDIDGDEDLDVIAPNCIGFFGKDGPTAPEPLLVFLNDGAASFTDGSAIFGNLDKAVRQVAVGDIDRDGDLDVFIPDADVLGPDLLFVAGPAGFVEEGATRLPAGLSSTAGATRFGDVDGDGDLDLLVLNGFTEDDPDFGALYANDGSGVFSEVAGAFPPIDSGADPDDIDLLDVDRDFDLDVLVNMHEGKPLLWINDGSGAFTDASDGIPPMPGNYQYNPGVCDVDGDGDLDVWAENARSDRDEMLTINDGSGVFTDVTETQVLDAHPTEDDNGVICADIDGDGDLDATVASLTTRERVFYNDGGGTFAEADVQAYPVGTDSTLWLDYGDLNGDGRLDAVTVQGEFGVQIDRFYLGTANAPVDTVPPRVIVTEPIGGAPPDLDVTVRFAVSDNAVTDVGPRLSRAFVRLDIGGQASEVDAWFVGGDLFHAVIPAQAEGTTVTYTACAIDRQGNEGCGEEGTFGVNAGATTGSTTGSGSTGSTGSGAGGAGATGAGGGAAPGEEDEGCDCRAAGSPSSRSGLAALVALAAGAAALRRRRGR